MDIQIEFWSLMNDGGPIMWVIFFVACIAMVMLAWEGLRGLFLLKSARLDYQRLRLEGDLPSLERGARSPIAQLFTAINWKDIRSSEDVAKEFTIQLVEITPKMEGSLSTIATFGSLLPMLGLLGTVTGMINVFEVIALQGSGKPNEMADGISQALLTTASGLIIAIPVILFHHLLSRQINSLMVVIHQAIQLVLHRDVAELKEVYKHEYR